MLLIRTVPYVKQQTEADCGIACLLAIIRFYGHTVPREWLYKESHYTKEGVSMQGLLQAAEKLGFIGQGVECSFNKLEPLSLPVIAHTKIQDRMYHFVVMVEVGKQTIKIMDPASGYTRMTKEQFEKITTNYYLIVSPTSQLHSVTYYSVIAAWQKQFLRQHKWLLIYLVFLVLVLIGLEYSLLFQFKVLLNIALLPGSITNAFQLIFFFMQLLLLKYFVKYIITKYQLYIEYSFNRKLKVQFFKQLVTLPLPYYQLRDHGKILSLIDDMDFISQFNSKCLYILFYYFVLLIGLDIYMYYLSSHIFMIILLGHILFTGLILYEKKRMQQKYKLWYQHKSGRYRLEQRILGSIERIKGLHQEKSARGEMNHQEHIFLKANYEFHAQQQKQQLRFQFLENLLYLGVIAMVTYYFIIGKLSISLTTFILLEGFIISALQNYNQLLFLYLEWQLYREALVRVHEFFYCQPEKLLPHSQLTITEPLVSITICNLSFAYENQEILKRINLYLFQRDKVFLSGKSGSGKSTLVKLLGRYYPVSYGYIQINHRDITHYNLEAIRQLVSYITPKSISAAGSIQDIIMDKRPYQEKKFKKVLSICGILGMLTKKGYTLKTYLAEDASNLSSGERQRLLLAQGLYQESELYILDECLSMVDIATEKKIITRLCHEYQDKMIIYISHRVQLQYLFTRVFYLHQGCCYEKKNKP